MGLEREWKLVVEEELYQEEDWWEERD